MMYSVREEQRARPVACPPRPTMTTDQRRAYAAQIRHLTDHGQHREAYALWLRTIAPQTAKA
jgi:hypothetical protein